MRYIFFTALLALLAACSQKHDNKATNQSTPSFDSTAILNASIAKLYNPEEAARKAFQLDTFFHRLHEKNGFNGAVLIAQYGRVIYKNAFGVADFTRKDTLTPETSFQLASVSKQFTAVAIMKLKEMGKLSYEDSVQRFIPGFPYHGITIRHLLTHRSGLPNYMYSSDEHVKDRRTPISNEQVIQLLMQHQPEPYFSPDRRFMYSNTGYSLLASIVEKASGVSFKQFVETTIFKPLGMTRTQIYMGENTLTLQNTASGYTAGRRKVDISYLDGVVGDKGVYSTVEDLFKWDRALYSNQLLSQATLEEAFTPHSPELKVQNYGYGWRLRKTQNGEPIIFHSGWWHGFKSYFMRNRKDQSTVIVLSNVANYSMSHIKTLHEIMYPNQTD